MNSQPLKFNYEFSRVYKRGNFATGKHLSLHVFKRYKGLKHNETVIPFDIKRVGFCANKKQLGAVGRNRARRLMREAYRLLEDRIPDGNDLVFTLRTSAPLPEYSVIKKEMESNLTRLGLLSGKEDQDG